MEISRENLRGDGSLRRTWVLTLGELKVGARWMLGREGQRETEREGEAVELTLK